MRKTRDKATANKLKLPKKHPLSTENALGKYRSGLLDWYGRNRRKLPWRKSPTLYKTVVSEFMLQQTRVATALPYFERWLNEFPDFDSLAQASEERVLKAWEGLGYYSRARNLRKLAQSIVTLKEVPQDPKSWQSFPGVGPYVAAAVTSISYGAKVAVVDGNVVRVLTRLFAIDDEFRDGATAQRKLRPLAQKLLDSSRPGDYNQAVMELGATVCHRKSPLCPTCPVLKHCKAGQRDETEKFPRISGKKIQKITIERLWVRKKDSILLREIPIDSKRLAGLLELPRPEDFPTAIKTTKKKLVLTRQRSIGNQSIKECIRMAELQKNTKFPQDCGLRYVKIEKLNEATLSAPHRKWLKELLEQER